MNKQRGSVTFLGLLSLILITLKLMEIIEWSWFWVLSPFWMVIIFVILSRSLIGILSDD